jgi:hypothetical protein
MQCCVDCFVQFNHLIDAILAVKDTRAMYLRRLRSLMDDFLAAGASNLSCSLSVNRARAVRLSLYSNLHPHAALNPQAGAHSGGKIRD